MAQRLITCLRYTTFQKFKLQPGRARSFTRTAVGVCGVATLGAYYLYWQSTCVHAKSDTARFVLYQYSNCPFCSKVRAYLHYSGQEFEIVEVNPITKEETKAITDYKKVPVLVADGVVLKDSTVITSILHTHLTTGSPVSDVVEWYPAVIVDTSSKVPVIRFNPDQENMRETIMSRWNNIINYFTKLRQGKEKSEYPNKYVTMGYDPKKNDAMKKEVKWRRWIDNHFVHLISPNVYRTWSEALSAFDYFTTSGKFTDFQKFYARYIGAAVMYVIGNRLRKRHDLNVDVRSDMYSGINHWLRGMKGCNFMGGSEPNLADIEMWGMCSAFHGLETWDDVCRTTKIEPWYNRMEKYLQTRSAQVIETANPKSPILTTEFVTKDAEIRSEIS